jgi:energy-coupling factor transporter transmembrane protein EcfT
MNLQKEIQQIKSRNKRVELDKAWEVSLTRKILLAIITYIVITLFFLVANLPKPFINPIVPTLGFLISTLLLPFFKKAWISKRDKR